ncbi:MAG TPA: hypothetical protein DEH25_16885 [Chloroflexi bacterium]|nr:hypothetical protein [Chloroflexota bacterium]HBY09581.1 hypothetical protein [Chloroflexota bacterium]
MDKKTLTITIIITTLLCGLPGLCGLCFGSMAILGAFLPDTGIAPEEATLVTGIAVMIVGASMIAILIPLGIGVWNWWAQRPDEISMDEVLIPEDDF